MISFDDFSKIEMKAGTIERAESVEKSDKLLKLSVDFGEEKRQVISGIAQYYTIEELVGKQFIFITNLEPRSIMGFESQAMILATDEEVGLVSPVKPVPNGAKLR